MKAVIVGPFAECLDVYRPLEGAGHSVVIGRPHEDHRPALVEVSNGHKVACYLY